MFIIVIGRAYPEKRSGMIGIFEKEQALTLLHAGHKVVYAFSDNRSVKVVHSLKKIKRDENGLLVYGRQMPIKGLPQPLFDRIKSAELKKLIRRIIDEQGMPDAIHIHFPLLTVTAPVLDYIKTLPCKLVCTEHWTKVQNKTIAPRRVTLLKKAVGQADAFISVSSKLRDSVRDLTKTEKELYVVPNVVSADFHYIPKKQKDADTFSFAAVGRLVPVKRFHVAAAAFAKAFRDNPAVSMKIVGGGVEYASLAKQIKELNMQDRIILTGVKERREVAEILGQTDCYVSASVLETFGVPFIEAWVTGIPCIGAKDGPIDEFFTEDRGMLFPPDDVDALAAAMRTMYEKRAQFDGEQISKWAVSHFSEESVAARLAEIYGN
ncbi:MAG: glycosyltransferase [Oscillospiraceae bacterium]|nr:glycosyltransferase [Oscillospiraceae bacterium]MCR5306765.1 glycosyltransferase [Oscillospiraceae bacterium]